MTGEMIEVPVPIQRLSEEEQEMIRYQQHMERQRRYKIKFVSSTGSPKNAPMLFVMGNMGTFYFGTLCKSD